MEGRWRHGPWVKPRDTMSLKSISHHLITSRDRIAGVGASCLNEGFLTAGIKAVKAVLRLVQTKKDLGLQTAPQAAKDPVVGTMGNDDDRAG